MTSNAAAPGGLGPYAAAALVFGASAAVLVVELVALRLLAPYLGLTLETSTVVIGSALAAIAAGSWSGGRLADAVPPRRLLAPLLAISGVAVAATPPAVRAAGSVEGGTILLMIVAGLGIVIPGTFLSAITPMVTKLRLSSLDQTGRVVGRLSGIGTVGAIVGTVVTGFILISRVPVSGIMVGLGIALVAAAVAVELRFRSARWAAVPALLLVLSGVGAAVAPGGCDAETAYHCAVVVHDPERATGRVLLLDGAPHSYVDLADPTHLEFAYARSVVAAIDTAYAPGQPLRAYHLGAGALTLPQFLEHTRPGGQNLVSEIDPGVVAIDRERLGYDPRGGISVQVEDGRLGLRRLTAGSQDLVVGDAFGGISVPWHLTTQEAVREVERVLSPDGTYLVNMIDRGPLAFARAEVATLGAEFDHVALMARTDTLARTGGGNLVAIASPAPIDTAGIAARLADTDTGWGVITGAELDAWVDGASVLNDDYAPVDQLLTPYTAR